MKPELQIALYMHLVSLGDDELILGHRNSEWCGHAPILEEDIAFANISLDEIGHANFWYSLAAEIKGEDPDSYPDQLVYFRGEEQYRSLQIVELSRGDWAFTILRQYLFDALEKVRLTRLSESKYQPAADAAAKILKEEMYHYRHSKAWVHRLGLGTDESQQRMQKALDELWPFAYQAFAVQDDEQDLIEAEIIPHPHDLQKDWEKVVLPTLREAQLSTPSSSPNQQPRREHTNYLKVLLAELQYLTRTEPEAVW
jgi:ring-1,2-phenylacetyl-CoA epoxidase subunit PaaC